jgi:hypothetical protein
MTDLSHFSDDERAQIMGATRAVMEGAIFADGSVNAIRFLKELTAGARVFKEAQRHENGFVKAVANGIRESKDTAPEGRGLPDPEVAVAKALGEAERAVALLRDRVDAADLDAYGEWLIRIATEIAKASRSKRGGFFSKKVAISDAERGFIDEITRAVAA